MNQTIFVSIETFGWSPPIVYLLISPLPKKPPPITALLKKQPPIHQAVCVVVHTIIVAGLTCRLSCRV